MRKYNGKYIQLKIGLPQGEIAFFEYHSLAVYTVVRGRTNKYTFWDFLRLNRFERLIPEVCFSIIPPDARPAFEKNPEGLYFAQRIIGQLTHGKSRPLAKQNNADETWIGTRSDYNFSFHKVKRELITARSLQCPHGKYPAHKLRL